MIRFFRNIRKQLITQTRIRKYLFYAFGEIILVMMGILLALQVNNWNEERKLGTVRAQYIKTIIADLQKDSVVFSKSIEWYDRDLKKFQKFNEKIDDPSTTMDTIRKMARYQLIGFSNDEGRPSISNIDAIIASGNINLFTDSVQQHILNYHNFQKRFEERLERMTELGTRSEKYNDITPTGHPFVKSYYFQGHMRDRIWASKSDDLVLEAVDNFITSKITSNGIILNAYKALQENTIEFLMIMNSLPM